MLWILGSLCLVNAALIFYFALKHRSARHTIPPNSDLNALLNDFRVHGFTYLRIDPDSMLLRSPREKRR